MIQLRKWFISILLIGASSAFGQHLTPAHSFFAGLDSLAAGKDTVITIVHLGDSHIQAGFMTGRIMRSFHQRFGNAGRGWVAPYKLGKSNQPADYFITSEIREWLYGRCIQHTKKCPIGLGGVGLQTPVRNLDMNVTIAKEDSAAYGFSKAILYRGESSTPLFPVTDSLDSTRILFSREAVVPGVRTDTFSINRLTSKMSLSTSSTLERSDSDFVNLYYGFSLMNGNPGILYHSVGVNGAMFVNYTSDDYVRQLALLNPDLLIISLGTNETFGKRFTGEEFTSQITAFMKLVRTYMPDAAILLTTPPECYKQIWSNKKKVFIRNENSEKAARAILEFARKEGLGCWDLFTAAGGKNSSQNWFNKGLMGRDRVHFKPTGYEKQGEMLFEALMEMYDRQSVQPDSEL